MIADILQHAQTGSEQLERASASRVYSHIPLLSSTESAEDWLRYEQLLYSYLIIGDDETATSFLALLERRFGAENDKLSGFRSVLQEAQASTQQLDTLLREHDTSVRTNPTNIPLAKRRIVILRELDKDQEAVTSLCRLLDLNPTDAETWSELADFYIKKGYLKQALFCLEEVLLTQPNAWNLHAQIGELYLRMIPEPGSADFHSAVVCCQEAVWHFCRSIELCDDYIRGYCGLRQSTIRFTRLHEQRPQVSANMSADQISRLLDYATSKLASFVQSYRAQEFVPADVHAARAILAVQALCR